MKKLNNPTQEEWFDIWCKELIEAGYIDEIVVHPNVPTFELFPGLKKEYTESKKLKNNKNKLIKKSSVLMRPVVYTPDRIIKWNQKAMTVFFIPFSSSCSIWKECYFMPHQHPTEEYFYSIIEVKGPTGNQKAYGSDFKFTQKWLWANTQQYVQKVMLAPAKLFKQEKSFLPYLWAMTFTPERFLYTDKLSVNKNKPIPYRTIPNKKGVPLWEVRSLETFLKKKGSK